MKKFIEPQARLIAVEDIATDTNINITGSNPDNMRTPGRAGSVASQPTVTDFD